MALNMIGSSYCDYFGTYDGEHLLCDYYGTTYDGEQLLCD